MWDKFTLNDIEHSANVIIWDNQKRCFVLDDPDFRNCNLNIDNPASNLFDLILDKVGKKAKEASKVEISFDKIIPPVENWWRASSKEGLKIPIGLAGAQNIQYLEFGTEMKHHGLIVGIPGSGKSNLFHVLITASSLIYSPQEFEFYLIDLKEGAEFKTYAANELPHARVLAVESDIEFATSVIEGLTDELERRGKLFTSVGTRNIIKYREKTNKNLPRIMLLIDEYQKLFTENDGITPKKLLDNLVKEGRYAGIHVLLSSQSLNGYSTLLKSTIDQMTIKIAFKCSDAESRIILAEDNPAASALSRPGEAIYNNESGAVNSNKRVQVVLLQQEEQDLYLQKISDKAKKQKYIPPNPQIVFESETLGQITKNRILHNLLITYPHISASNEKRIWLGEPISMKGPIMGSFKHEGKNNLVIIGDNDTASAGMLLSSIIALASQYSPKDLNLYIVNLSDTACSKFFPKLSDIIPHHIRVIELRDLQEILNEIAKKVNDRLERGYSTSDSSLYFVIYGLHQARLLKGDDFDPYGDFSVDTAAKVNPTKQLATILTEGSNLGVHTLVWCDSYTNLSSRIGERLIQEFDMRVALQVTESDSNDLIDAPSANKLGLFRALYLSKKKGELKKFKPYGLPTEEWLAFVKKQFKK